MSSSAEQDILTITLDDTLKTLCAPGKGIFAADESIASVSKKFTPYHIANTPESRASYRSMLLSTHELAHYISGVILYDETFKQAKEGVTFPAFLTQQGVIPGIKVDLGLSPFGNHNGEEITKGLEDLEARCRVYFNLGARFAKWRAVYFISPETPSVELLNKNAHTLAQYAKTCQRTGLVPMVEPELLTVGKHDIEACYQVTSKILQTVFQALEEHDVDLSRIILKPNMVTSGSESLTPATKQEVAFFTYKCLSENVPQEVPAIMFLSGGQSDEDAACHLNEIVKLNQKAWRITFSYGRALQDKALSLWLGKEENVARAQLAVLHNIQKNSKASMGQLKDE